MANTSDPSPYWYAANISDTVNLTQGECHYIYVGTTGNLVVTTRTGDVTFTNLAVGYHPIMAVRIKSTGTTAAGILVAY
jgi:hypothetical protein